jgi:Asp-tRNA(Asn)/Glu-tRNA(Gln) amidotransferase A subunit family amidase
VPVDPFSSATELAAAIRARRTSAAELVELYLGRIERHNSSLNAVCTLDAVGAQRRAREADAALGRGELWGTAYTSPFNLTGHPCVVLPLTRSRDGMPIGVQLVARCWSEPALLALAQKVSLITGPFTPPAGFKS